VAAAGTWFSTPLSALMRGVWKWHAAYMPGTADVDRHRTDSGLWVRPEAAARSRKFMSRTGQEWSNRNRSLGSRRSTECHKHKVTSTGTTRFPNEYLYDRNGREVPFAEPANTPAVALAYVGSEASPTRSPRWRLRATALALQFPSGRSFSRGSRSVT
jgi:hypothetical protein